MPPLVMISYPLKIIELYGNLADKNRACSFGGNRRNGDGKSGRTLDRSWIHSNRFRQRLLSPHGGTASKLKNYPSRRVQAGKLKKASRSCGDRKCFDQR